ncbi:MAG: sigma-70 family RNA polymerase sigma factor [Pirellulales bacterium]|nr:sigma-70 family RNA polymerase sigma factor [Pirellulales bacterium]
MRDSADGSNSGAPGERVAEFVALYSRYYPRLQYFLMALLPTANDAEDVLQETSLVLWRKFDTYRTGSNFYAWACKIARIQTLRYRERMGKSAQLLDDDVLEKLCEQAMTQQADPTASLEALAYCLERLSERNRSLIRRRYQPNASVAKLAEETGRSANALSKLLGNIRRVLLDCVQKQMTKEQT